MHCLNILHQVDNNINSYTLVQESDSLKWELLKSGRTVKFKETLHQEAKGKKKRIKFSLSLQNCHIIPREVTGRTSQQIKRNLRTNVSFSSFSLYSRYLSPSKEEPCLPPPFQSLCYYIKALLFFTYSWMYWQVLWITGTYKIQHGRGSLIFHRHY